MRLVHFRDRSVSDALALVSVGELVIESPDAVVESSCRVEAGEPRAWRTCMKPRAHAAQEEGRGKEGQSSFDVHQAKGTYRTGSSLVEASWAPRQRGAACLRQSRRAG